MPLFSLRGRGSKRRASEPAAPLKPTASLPDLAATGLGAWPESLVDAPSLALTTPHNGASTPQGPAKTSLQLERGPIPFHRPFRANGPPPSAFPTGAPPSAFYRRSTEPSTPAPHKRPRPPPTTFNLLVAGSKGSGKSALLNLLLDTSPLANQDSVQTFKAGSRRRTREVRTASVEVEGVRPYLLTVVDTPGLDLNPRKELEFDRAVSGLVRYQEGLMGETLVMESQVVRQFAPDQHIHICLYLIDPRTVIRRPPQSPHPTSPKTKAKNRFPLTPTSDDDDDDASSDHPDHPPYPLSMHPWEVRAIQRLSMRYHVLPLIGRADSLTANQLKGIKEAVERDLRKAGVGWGMFGLEEVKPAVNGNGSEAHSTIEEKEEEDEPETPRKVIQIRPTVSPPTEADNTKDKDKDKGKEHPLRRSRSLSRARTAPTIHDTRFPPPPSSISASDDTDSILGPAEDIKEEKAALARCLPFAVIAPEAERTAADSDKGKGRAGDGDVVVNGVRGRWVRRYRWGAIDVMDPEHCDFPALRRTVLELYFTALKSSTRATLYERFRTEKLLARRATSNMTEEERKNLLAI